MSKAVQNAKQVVSRLEPEPHWTQNQQRLLAVLQREGFHKVKDLCKAAGFTTVTPWYTALLDERFEQAVAALGIKLKRHTPRQRLQAKQRFLALLQQEEARHWSVEDLCRQAGYASKGPWYDATKDAQFVQAIVALGIKVRRHTHNVSHLEVELAPDPEEEFKKDRWDIRRLKADYAKHRGPHVRLASVIA